MSAHRKRCALEYSEYSMGISRLFLLTPSHGARVRTEYSPRGARGEARSGHPIHRTPPGRRCGHPKVRRRARPTGRRVGIMAASGMGAAMLTRPSLGRRAGVAVRRPRALLRASSTGARGGRSTRLLCQRTSGGRESRGRKAGPEPIQNHQVSDETRVKARWSDGTSPTRPW